MAMGSMVLGLLLLWIVPLSQSFESPLQPSPSSDQTPPSSTLTSHPTTTPKATISSTIYHALTKPNVLLCIPVFLVGTLRYTTLNVLIQYSSLRFKTKISQGAIFYTETAVVNILLFLFLVPRFTAFIQSKHHVMPKKMDLALVRISVCFLLLGSLAIGLAPTSGWIPVGKETYVLYTTL